MVHIRDLEAWLAWRQHPAHRGFYYHCLQLFKGNPVPGEMTRDTGRNALSPWVLSQPSLANTP